MSQRTVEEYLETIGALEDTESPVSTTSIAQSMGVSLASVSEMLRRLAEKGLVLYELAFIPTEPFDFDFMKM